MKKKQSSMTPVDEPFQAQQKLFIQLYFSLAGIGPHQEYVLNFVSIYDWK